RRVETQSPAEPSTVGPQAGAGKDEIVMGGAGNHHVSGGVPVETDRLGLHQLVPDDQTIEPGHERSLVRQVVPACHGADRRYAGIGYATTLSPTNSRRKSGSSANGVMRITRSAALFSCPRTLVRSRFRVDRVFGMERRIRGAISSMSAELAPLSAATLRRPK